MARTSRTSKKSAPAVALPSTIAAAQRVRLTARGAPTDFSGPAAEVAAMAGCLSADEATRTGQLLGRDGLTADTLPLLWENTRGGAFETVIEGWKQQVAQERTAEEGADRVTDWTQLRLDRRDRALYRLGGPGAPITEHALGQLIGALSAGGTGFRSACSALSWCSPAAAAQLFVELQGTARRDRTQPLTVRTGFRLRQGIRAADAVTRERVVRAVMTSRSSGVHFDDPALMAVLQQVTPAQNRAFVQRAALGTETRGWVEVTNRATKSGLDLSVSFRGSETGEARLGFRASARIRLLDAVVVAHRGVEVLDETEIELGTQRGTSERNHTLPTISTKELREKYNLAGFNGDRLTEAQRASIAAQRMTESFELASKAAFELGIQWDVALQTFAPGSGGPLGGGTALDTEIMVQVILDLCEEHGMVLGADRAGIEAVLTDDARLLQLPHGSAAHVAAAFAALAARGTKVMVDGKATFQPLAWKEAQRLQEIAGRWVACGWDVKAHRAALSESRRAEES